MSEINLEYDKAVDKAQEFGLVIVEPDDYTLQLDLDSDEDYENFKMRLSLFETEEKIVEITVTRSAHGNRHVYMRLAKPVSAAQRIAYQATLGSDWKREMFSIMRLRTGNDHASLLFEVPNINHTVLDKKALGVVF